MCARTNIFTIKPISFSDVKNVRFVKKLTRNPVFCARHVYARIPYIAENGKRISNQTMLYYKHLDI